jgi:4-amino-4-deoxy-L-arabinose transferase-like glycosyltransferase
MVGSLVNGFSRSANMPESGVISATSRPARLALAALVLASLCLYFTVASQHALKSDEGTYATAALFFADGDLLLQKADTDKPPLVYQLEGVAAFSLGRSDLAVKVPNALAIAALILLTFALGRAVFDETAGLLAAALVAVSPFVNTIGIGAMTDPPAAAFLTASLLFAFRSRPATAGLLFGLAVLCRQMAFLYLPLPVIVLAWHAWPQPQRGLVLRTAGKRLVLGGLGPAVYLLVWSAFFQREPFRWLLQEVGSGKVTQAAGRFSFGARFGYWLDAVERFSISPWLIPVAALGLLLIFAHDVARRRRSEHWVAVAGLAGVALGYPLVHAFLGAPLYPRMMFPAAPLVLLLAAFAITRGATIWLAEPGRWLRRAVWLALAALVVGGTLTLAQGLAVPAREDDSPELVGRIRTLAERPTIVYSADMTRHLLFYLYGTRIKTKQWRDDPRRIAEFAPSNAGRLQLVAVRASEAGLEKTMGDVLNPRYRLARLFTTSGGLVTLYEIRPQARRIDTEGGPAIAVRTLTGEMAVPLEPATYRTALTAYANRRLGIDEPPRIDLEPTATPGRFDRLSIAAENVNLGKIDLATFEVVFTDLDVDLTYLIAAQELVVRRAATAEATITVTTDALAAFIEKKNPQLTEVVAQTKDGELILEGLAEALGRKISFELTGTLSLDENGGAWLNLTSGRFGGRSVPGFVLSAVGGAMNPTFGARLDNLGLVGRRIAAADDRIAITLR